VPWGAQEDLYYPHPWIQDRLWDALYYVAEPILRRFPGRFLRGVALREVMRHVHYEDENTRYICIGPVNKVSAAPQSKARVLFSLCGSPEACIRFCRDTSALCRGTESAGAGACSVMRVLLSLWLP